MLILGLTGCDAADQLSAYTPAVVHPVVVPAADYEFPVEWAGDYTFQWSAAAGIDLSDTEAAVVRAFAESMQLARSVGARLAYPGYADAIPDGQGLRVPDGGAYPPGAALGDWEQRWSGTFRARIMEIRPAATGFTAAYCVDDTDVAGSNDAGATFVWRQDRLGEPPRGIPMSLSVRSVTGTDHTDQPAGERGTIGPYRAPKFNVFEGWIIAEVQRQSARTDEGLAVIEGCTAWTQANAHVNPAYLPDTPRRVPATPPPESAPPTPGWGSDPADDGG